MCFIGSKEFHVSLAGMVIKYSFFFFIILFHISDGMPKAIIKHEVCVWSFFYCVLLLFELETLSVWAKIIFFSFFFFKMLMKIKHSVVEML